MPFEEIEILSLCEKFLAVFCIKCSFRHLIQIVDGGYAPCIAQVVQVLRVTGRFGCDEVHLAQANQREIFFVDVILCRKVFAAHQTFGTSVVESVTELVADVVPSHRGGHFKCTFGVCRGNPQGRTVIGSEIVKEAIINNSDVVMLLDQSKFKERFDTIKTILGLTDVDCKKIFTINRLENKEGRSFFREVFIRRGTTSGVYGVEEPRECYMTYTTERAEKEALKLYKRELQCSHQEAIEAYCRDWNTSGIGKALPFAQKVNEAGCVLNLTTKITS